LLPWAIVSATVSTVLRAVQERAGLLGRIVVGLIAMFAILAAVPVAVLGLASGVGVIPGCRRRTVCRLGPAGDERQHGDVGHLLDRLVPVCVDRYGTVGVSGGRDRIGLPPSAPARDSSAADQHGRVGSGSGFERVEERQAELFA
jgi:hypothetical protein